MPASHYSPDRFATHLPRPLPANPLVSLVFFSFPSPESPKPLFMASTTRTPLPRPPDTPPDFSPLHSRRYARSPALLSLPSFIKPFPKISIGRRRSSCLVAGSGTAMGENAVSDERMLVMVPPHPLIKHWISVLRNEQTPCPIFKSAMAELGRLLMYEASRDWLPTITGEIQSPVGPAVVEFIDPREPVVIIPILRAGLALAEHAPSVLPATITYHLGMCRDEETLQPSIYLNKLPDKFPEGSRVLVVDPMLATGNFFLPIVHAFYIFWLKYFDHGNFH